MSKCGQVCVVVRTLGVRIKFRCWFSPIMKNLWLQAAHVSNFLSCVVCNFLICSICIISETPCKLDSQSVGIWVCVQGMFSSRLPREKKNELSKGATRLS